jgi:PHD/YefM family antitoxin component YafN of YafNO toxin-antitoxin module
MQKVSNNDAQNEFLFVMDQVCSGLGPVLITGTRGNAVLVCEDEWRAMQNFIRKRSIPGDRESAVDGVAEPRAERAGENTV